MKYTVPLFSLLGLALASAGAESPLARAEYQLFNRHLNHTWLDSAYTAFTAARNADPKDEHVLYLWCRAHIQKGDDARAKSDKLRLFGRAKAIAETLIAQNDRSADGHCWWGVAQGRIGQTRGVLNSLFMISGLKRAFNRTLALDSGYTTAWDALGVLYYELPGFAGGDLGRSEEYLKRGIALDPNYALLRLDLAKVYIKQKRWAAARSELNTLVATAAPTYPGDFTLDDRPDAEKLLKQIADK